MHLNENNRSSPACETHTGKSGKPLSSLLFARTDTLVIQALRYIVVGAAATVVDMSVLYALTEFAHLLYLGSAAIGFISGIAVSYVMSIRWVFASRTMGNKGLELAVFALIGVIGLGLTELIMWTSVELMGIGYMSAKLVSVVLVFMWNFGIRRTLLFRRR